MSERDLRVGLLNTLLTTPHRDLAAVYPLHRDMLAQDARFYAQLAAWYADHGDVRDHREMFVISLCLSSFEGHRDVGLALLRRLPPYQVARVVDFIKGKPAKHQNSKERKAAKAHEAAPKSVVDQMVGRLRGRARRDAVLEVATRPEPKATGLGRNIPRSMRTEIELYLRQREADPHAWDSAMLHARAPLKRLYAGLHIPPDARAQSILFDDNPPADSAAFAVKEIARAIEPAQQARAIARARLPYRVAVSLVKQMTPTVLAALVDSMSPQEVINNVASLKERGAFDNPDIKALIESKLEAAKGNSRVSAYKAKVAAQAAGVSAELAEQLDDITQAQITAKGRITRPTALLVDKSGSMSVALEVGKQLGAMISALCETDLYVYAFDDVALPIQVQGDKLADWEKAFAGIRANGATSCGVGVEWLRRKGQRVEQIVMVTDEGENRPPLWTTALTNYMKEMNVQPDIIFVKVGQATDQLEKGCQQLGLPVRAFDFKGDYYALTNLIPLLTRPSMLDLLMEILDYPLPQRGKKED